MEKIFILDLKSGVNRKFDDLKDAKKYINVRSVATIQDAIKDGSLIKERFMAFQGKKLGNIKKREYINKYWESIDTSKEKWVELPQGIKVSNMGRFEGAEGPIYPSINNRLYLVLRYKNISYSATKLIAECFIAKRELVEHEIVCRNYGPLEIEARQLQLSTWDQYLKWGQRGSQKEVVLLDENGQAKAFYKTMKEAGQKNYLHPRTVSDALRTRNGVTCGMKFMLLDDYYKSIDKGQIIE